MAQYGRPDPYGKRITILAGVVVCLLVVTALLAPRADPDTEWYEHTGFEGDLVLLDAIDIVSDVDPFAQTQTQSLPGATQGVPTPITEKIRHDETLDPVPLEQTRGDAEADLRRLQRADPQLQAEIVDRDQVKMSRPAQQSSDFVLLSAVNPRYPTDAPASLRQREIVVRVNMYVNEAGRVEHAYVDRNDGGPRFEAAVLEAVRQWVYRPLVRNGEPSGFWDLIYFVFQIDVGGRATESGDGGEG